MMVQQSVEHCSLYSKKDVWGLNSPYVCMGFIRVLWFSPTVQKYCASSFYIHAPNMGTHIGCPKTSKIVTIYIVSSFNRKWGILDCVRFDLLLVWPGSSIYARFAIHVKLWRDVSCKELKWAVMSLYVSPCKVQNKIPVSSVPYCKNQLQVTVKFSCIFLFFYYTGYCSKKVNRSMLAVHEELNRRCSCSLNCIVVHVHLPSFLCLCLPLGELPCLGGLCYERGQVTISAKVRTDCLSTHTHIFAVLICGFCSDMYVF